MIAYEGSESAQEISVNLHNQLQANFKTLLRKSERILI